LRLIGNASKQSFDLFRAAKLDDVQALLKLSRATRPASHRGAMVG
jgi:hypothetical protein